MQKYKTIITLNSNWEKCVNTIDTSGLYGWERNCYRTLCRSVTCLYVFNRHSSERRALRPLVTAEGLGPPSWPSLPQSQGGRERWGLATRLPPQWELPSPLSYGHRDHSSRGRQQSVSRLFPFNFHCTVKYIPRTSYRNRKLGRWESTKTQTGRRCY